MSESVRRDIALAVLPEMLRQFGAGRTLALRLWTGTDRFALRLTRKPPFRGVEQSVARWAHNPEVAGSSPVPATSF